MYTGVTKPMILDENQVCHPLHYAQIHTLITKVQSTKKFSG